MKVTRQLLFGALLLLCSLLAVPAGAQERSLDSMEHRRWLSADGGPSQVGAIAQTRDGYLWLGTNDSLFRFDGMRFVRYEAAARNTLNIVASLLVVGDELWVGLRYGGVRVIRDGAMRAFPVGAGLPDGVIYSLARDRGGAIWAAADDGLARYAGGRWQRIGADWGFAGANARAVFTDRDGVLWAASGKRLLYLPEGSRSFVDTGLAVDTVSQIAQAPDGAIWVAERYGGTLHRVVLDKGQVTTASRQMKAAAIGLLFDRAGSLWLSTTGQGIRHIAQPVNLAALDSATVFTARQGLSSDFIWKMHEDSEGNMWVGTNAGLDRFRPRTLMPAAFPAGALNFALAAGADGSVWGGPSNRPAMRMVGDLVEQMAMPAPVNSAMTDSSGTVWMGGPSGIWRSRGNALERVAALPGAPGMETPVRAMARDAAGDLWVSINRVGLFRLRGGQWRAEPPVSALANQRMPVSALAAPGGWLWFGYRDSLLVARRGSEELRWTSDDGLDIGHVTALAQHGGRTWVGGQRGVGYIDGGRFQRLQLPENGLFNNIYAMVPVPVRDGRGVDLWLHTRSGIFQLTVAELRRAAADPQHRIRYRSFDLMGGLANDPYQVLPLPTAVRSSDGRLWFSTSGGVAWIDPARPPSQHPGPTVVIESVSVDGARVGTAAPLALGSGTQRVTVDYTALSLSAPEQLNFRYRLDGFDADWQDAGRERQASYTGLGPGNYTFRVMALNKDGMSSTQEATFSFNIALAFYREPLFLALMATLAAGSLWLAYKINMRRAAQRLRDRLEERHRERERIARELHDTLLQGVQGLVLRFHAVAGSMPQDAPARASLEQALDRADQVLVEGRDRVRDLRSGPQDARGLQQALAAVGAELAQQSGRGFSVHLAGQVKPLLPVVLDEVYRIAHEAIVNAFAHAGARQIRAEIGYGQEVFGLTISDDGRGIDPAFLSPQGRPDHWGLRGMHERAERIGASLEVCSGATRGAAITLSLPARMAYRRSHGRQAGWRGFLSR
ncbi:sensor histidine kinase [Massilia soli]|uniref:Histidine kinase/HSP90-like ATPase domain-containing protein n=1 Tax=Massilia soli TaxID=2792854 RepID=A0ABS7SUD0_9BURK|nr:two-component regulator propeller domain-containing protein [Massilia soli]MBZ2209554.1 hypothetical protein [Massilia soli]